MFSEDYYILALTIEKNINIFVSTYISANVFNRKFIYWNL